MDVFALATEMLGGIRLSPGQLANLRAINTEHYRRTAELLRDASGVPQERELTEAERHRLREMLVAAILDTLTPEQRQAMGGGGAPRGRR